MAPAMTLSQIGGVVCLLSQSLAGSARSAFGPERRSSLGRLRAPRRDGNASARWSPVRPSRGALGAHSLERRERRRWSATRERRRRVQPKRRPPALMSGSREPNVPTGASQAVMRIKLGLVLVLLVAACATPVPSPSTSATAAPKPSPTGTNSPSPAVATVVVRQEALGGRGFYIEGAYAFVEIKSADGSLAAAAQTDRYHLAQGATPDGTPQWRLHAPDLCPALRGGLPVDGPSNRPVRGNLHRTSGRFDRRDDPTFHRSSMLSGLHLGHER